MINDHKLYAAMLNMEKEFNSKSSLHIFDFYAGDNSKAYLRQSELY